MEYIILGVAGVGIIFAGFALTVLFKPGQPKEEDVSAPDNTVLTTLNDDLTQVKTDLGKMASAYQNIETEVLLAKKLASDTQAELPAVRKEVSQALTPILAEKEELKKKIQALEEEVKKPQGNKGVAPEEVGEIKKKIQSQEEDNKKLIEGLKKLEEGMKKIQESASSASPQDALNEIKVQIRAKDEELKKLQQGQESFGKEIEALKQSTQKQVAPAPAGVAPEALKQVQESVKKDIDELRQSLQAKEQALGDAQKTIAAIGKDIEGLRGKIEAQAKEVPAPATAPSGVTKEDLEGLKKRMENAEQVLRVLSGGG
jgi:chromosome segregation ATPase